MQYCSNSTHLIVTTQVMNSEKYKFQLVNASTTSIQRKLAPGRDIFLILYQLYLTNSDLFLLISSNRKVIDVNTQNYQKLSYMSLYCSYLQGVPIDYTTSFSYLIREVRS